MQLNLSMRKSTKKVTKKVISKKNSGKRGNPQNLTPWQKGQTGNINGRPKLTEQEKAAREQARKIISELWSTVLDKPPKELQKMLAKENLSMVENWLIRAAMTGAKKGDLSELHKMFDRLLGKPKQIVAGDGDNPLMIFVDGDFK
jgi:hypothetical protein